MCDNARECASPASQGFRTPVLRSGDGPVGRREIRPIRDEESASVLAIINEAAQAYRGIIPPDRFSDPYMSADYLSAEVDSGVRFLGYEVDGELQGVMGSQDVADVTLIRHAYVLPSAQRAGVGGRLLRHLLAHAQKPLFVGTWADADWAIAFYEKHGFRLTARDEGRALLGKYWDIPERQTETSVVLVRGNDD